MDNAKDIRSHAYEDYCTATEFILTYSVPYKHSQNELTDAFIKKVQMVTRPFVLHSNLPYSMWGHSVLHTTNLFKLRPTILNTQTPFEL